MKNQFFSKNNLKNLAKSIAKYAALFVVVFIIIFSLINWPAVSGNIKYFWQNLTGKNKVKTQDEFLPQAESVKQPTVQEMNLVNNHIYIKKLNLDVPVVWDSPENQFLANLKYGVVHYQGTAKPGEKGNIFIAGHSSSYWWQRGPYSAIFSIIDKLTLGDEVLVTYNNRVYFYQVTEKFVVKPSQVEVMNPTPNPTLTLMTCVPVGTALNRLIVRASQVIP